MRAQAADDALHLALPSQLPTLEFASIRFTLRTEFRSREKMDQTKAVLTNLAQYSKDMPAIILGDLNTWERDAVDKTSKLFPAENFTTPFDDDQATFSRRILIIPIKFKLDWICLRGLEATSHGIDRR